MIDAAFLRVFRQAKIVFAKAVAWLVVLPPALYLVSQNGKGIGVLKETPDGHWQFLMAADETPVAMGSIFASPTEFIIRGREYGLFLRLDHVPFPG